MALNTEISLVTVENIELALGYDCNVYTLQIERAINQYSAILEGLTGRKLKARNYTNYRIDGNGSQELFFPQYPLNTTTSILIYDENDILYHTVLVAELEEYITFPQIGKMRLPRNIFLRGTQNVVVTANAGIVDAGELAMLENAVLEMIASNPPSEITRASNIKMERLGSYSVTWQTPSSNNFTGFSSNVQNIVNYFSRV